MSFEPAEPLLFPDAGAPSAGGAPPEPPQEEEEQRTPSMLDLLKAYLDPAEAAGPGDQPARDPRALSMVPKSAGPPPPLAGQERSKAPPEAALDPNLRSGPREGSPPPGLVDPRARAAYAASEAQEPRSLGSAQLGAPATPPPLMSSGEFRTVSSAIPPLDPNPLPDFASHGDQAPPAADLDEGDGEPLLLLEEEVDDIEGLDDFGPAAESSFGESSFGESSFGESSFGESSFGESSFGESSFGESSFGEFEGPGAGDPFGGAGAIDLGAAEDEPLELMETEVALEWAQGDAVPGIALSVAGRSRSGAAPLELGGPGDSVPWIELGAGDEASIRSTPPSSRVASKGPSTLADDEEAPLWGEDSAEILELRGLDKKKD